MEQIVESDWIINLFCSVPFLSERKLKQIQLFPRNGTEKYKSNKRIISGLTNHILSFVPFRSEEKNNVSGKLPLDNSYFSAIFSLGILIKRILIKKNECSSRVPFGSYFLDLTKFYQ